MHGVARLYLQPFLYLPRLRKPVGTGGVQEDKDANECPDLILLTWSPLSLLHTFSSHLYAIFHVIGSLIEEYDHQDSAAAATEASCHFHNQICTFPVTIQSTLR